MTIIEWSSPLAVSRRNTLLDSTGELLSQACIQFLHHTNTGERLCTQLGASQESLKKLFDFVLKAISHKATGMSIYECLQSIGWGGTSIIGEVAAYRSEILADAIKPTLRNFERFAEGVLSTKMTTTGSSIGHSISQILPELFSVLDMECIQLIQLTNSHLTQAVFDRVDQINTGTPGIPARSFAPLVTTSFKAGDLKSQRNGVNTTDLDTQMPRFMTRGESRQQADQTYITGASGSETQETYGSISRSVHGCSSGLQQTACVISSTTLQPEVNDGVKVIQNRSESTELREEDLLDDSELESEEEDTGEEADYIAEGLSGFIFEAEDLPLEDVEHIDEY